MVRKLGLPFAAVLNRAGSGDGGFRDYLAAEGIPLALELPDERRIAESGSRGEMLIDAFPEYRPRFEQTIEKLFFKREGS
jgi:MinD superfamily P-loop ATPase